MNETLIPVHMSTLYFTIKHSKWIDCIPLYKAQFVSSHLFPTCLVGESWARIKGLIAEDSPGLHYGGRGSFNCSLQGAGRPSCPHTWRTQRPATFHSLDWTYSHLCHSTLKRVLLFHPSLLLEQLRSSLGWKLRNINMLKILIKINNFKLDDHVDVLEGLGLLDTHSQGVD